MGLRGRLKNLAREAGRARFVFELGDGTTARFHRHEYTECFIHEMERGRRSDGGEEPGPAHPMIEALRKVSEEEMARVMRDHGTLLGALVGEDAIIRGERERPGPPVAWNDAGTVCE
jgi:hypothetical protein